MIVKWLLAFLVVQGLLVSSQVTAGSQEQAMPYTDAEKKTLHAIARSAIAARVAGKPFPPLPPLTPALKEKRGAFVTLHLDHQLRGCIGTIEPIKPLAEVVQEMAVAAAFQDPRFPPSVRQRIGPHRAGDLGPHSFGPGNRRQGN